MKELFPRPVIQDRLPYLASGLLFGLSGPSYPYVHLEVFAWVWMAPALLALKQVKSFWKFLLNVYLAALIVSVFGMSWLITSTVLGTILLFFVGALVFTVPFVGFYFVRKALGWRAALWSAPVVWTAWDWLYHTSEGSFGWLAMGVTQSNLYWLVQYVDITGVWGITFWLVLFNVLVVMAIDEFRVANFGLRIEKPTPQGESQILDSFRIQQSAIRNRLVRRLAVIAVVMLLPPLAYSAFSFIRASRHAAGGREISVLMVQPNIDPWQKFDARTGPAILRKTLALTDSALRRQKPDLIVWPESAVPYFFLDDQPVQEVVKRAVARWDVPLLTGVLDRQIHHNSQGLPPPSDHEEAKTELFNAALLLTPESAQAQSEMTLVAGNEPLARGNNAPSNRWRNVKTSQLYRKRVLMPFVERVPFQDRFPALTRLTLSIGGRGGFSPGKDPTVFSFRSRQGEPITVAAAICYDQLYPAKIADFARQGTDLIVLITNEGWWSKTHGPYQLAAFTRLRAIETRRSIARSANTGLTCLIDPLGRIYAQAPWWEPTTLSGEVRPSRDLSLYVRYPDYLPKACAWFVLALLIAALAKRIDVRWRKRSLRCAPTFQEPDSSGSLSHLPS